MSAIRSEASSTAPSLEMAGMRGCMGLENEEARRASALFLDDVDDGVSAGGWGLAGSGKVGPEGRFDLFFQVQKIKRMAHEASASLDDIMRGKVTIK